METTNDNLIDKQLYISMQQGNKKAFDTLFIKYYAMLCAFARSFVSLEDAERSGSKIPCYRYGKIEKQII